MAYQPLREEIGTIISFLCKRGPRTFRRRDGEWDSFEITDDPREAILLASLVPDAFFLKKSTDGGRPIDAFGIRLPIDFGGVWGADLRAAYPEVFEGSTKVVKFVQHWAPMWDVDDRTLQRRRGSRLGELELYLQESGIQPGDCLFVPYKEYRGRLQLGELVYHYLSGLIFKEAGYLVCNEYPLSGYSGERPDVCAFKTPEIGSLLFGLRRRGVVWAGAFLEELQLFSAFGRQGSKAPRPDAFPLGTEAEGVAVEVERAPSQRRGRSQLLGYLAGTQGLFDEGYLAGPAFERSEATITFSDDGELIFARPKPAYGTSALLPHQAERRKRQLDDLRATAMIQLSKNLPVGMIVSLCESDGSLVGSYQDLLALIASIDSGALIDAITRR
jgi:hypothetical protein